MSKTPEVDAEIRRNKARDRQEKSGIAKKNRDWEAGFRRQEQDASASRAYQNELDQKGRQVEKEQRKPSEDTNRQRRR